MDLRVAMANGDIFQNRTKSHVWLGRFSGNPGLFCYHYSNLQAYYFRQMCVKNNPGLIPNPLRL